MAPRELDDADRERACALLDRLYHPRNCVAGKGIRVPRTFPTDELEWLAERGLSPNQRSKLTHAAAVRKVRSASDRATIRDGARAFAAGLGEGPPHGVLLEAAMLAHRLPAHRFTAPRSGGACRVCMMGPTEVVDVAKRFLEWHREGGGIPGDLTWATWAVDRLQTAPVRRVPPEATARLASILCVIDDLPDDARMSQAVDAIRTVDVLGPDPLGARARAVLETLSFAGVLDAPPHRGVAEAWVDFSVRDTRPNKHVEVEAPLSFWRGADGVHWRHARELFGMGRTQAARQARNATSPGRSKSTTGQLRGRNRSGHGSATKAIPKPPPSVKRLPRRPAVAGDVWAIRVREDTYVIVYVWDVTTRAKRPWARVEFLDWIGATPPDMSSIRTFGIRPRYDGRWQMRVSGLHDTSGTALLATSLPAPRDTRPPPDRIPGGAAKDLGWLADDCFPELDAELA